MAGRREESQAAAGGAVDLAAKNIATTCPCYVAKSFKVLG